MPIEAKKLNELKVEIPYKFKPQTVNSYAAMMVSYIDSRDVQDILDNVVGPDNWQDEYYTINNILYCKIGINVLHEDGSSEWIYKTDCGTEAKMEAEKSASSDSFKRAAVKFGIGRFLYRTDTIKLKTTKVQGKDKPTTDKGEVLWTNEDITNYIRTYKLGKKTNTNTTNTTKNESSNKKERYNKKPNKVNYSKPEWSDSIIETVKNLEYNNKKGKECLKEALPEYNKVNNTEYKLISELNTDNDLQKLIDFVQNQIPEGL